MAEMEIQKMANGFVVTVGVNRGEVYTSLEDVFARLLLFVEGRCKSFTGNAYGRVIIERESAPAARENEP